ncbi:hypothetical protein [Streptomyces sp. NBC_01506]|uniref:hypothetical protein n=1 Tax=Streptomyces sp. NBC_01506 TaxID=2903887 RepID=UPI00386D5916
MGMYHSTYFAYGIHVVTDQHGWQASEHAETELPKVKDRCPNVGYLTAGNYDEDMLFLVTESTEVDLGKFEHVTPARVSAEQQADWDRQLAEAARALGYGEFSSAGWLVVPDLS